MTPNLLIIATIVCGTPTYTIYDMDTKAYVQDVDYTHTKEIIQTIGANPYTITITPKIECKV